MTSRWLTTINNHVATLTLNRAEVQNRLDDQTLRELREHALDLNANSEVWAIILQAAGEHFSVGMDVNAISNLQSLDPDAMQTNLVDLQQCLVAFEQISKPKVASIQGYCLGGALLLALCCDFRIASSTAKFGFPEVKRSIAVIMGTQRITKISGIAATKEMVLLGELFNVQQARQYNLLHHVFEPDQLQNQVVQFANKFQNLPPAAVSIANQIIDHGYSMSLDESMALETELQLAVLQTNDFQEAIQSFFEKRPPQYHGH